MELDVERGQVVGRLKVIGDDLVEVGLDGRTHRREPLRSAELRQAAAGEPMFSWNGWPYRAVGGVVAAVAFLEYLDSLGAETVVVLGAEPETQLSEPTTLGESARSAVSQASATSSSPTAADRAVRAARFVEMCSYVFGATGVVLGLIIAFSDGDESSEQYPLFWFGVLTAVLAAFQAAIVVMISAYVQARLSRPVV